MQKRCRILLLRMVLVKQQISSFWKSLVLVVWSKRIGFQPEGHGGGVVCIGQACVKKLLGLVWWIKDLVGRDQEITPGE